MTLAAQLALWADQLRDISAMGLHFAKNIHDETAFRAVQNVAMAMLALATGQSIEQIEPLRGPIFSRPMPLTVGEAAVIDRQGRMLLIQRADNGKWAMPGGALEVGETPAAGVLREALEETGMHCRAVSLVGVFDSRFCGTTYPHHFYQFVFLCEPVPDMPMETPSHAIETRARGWFAEDGLPADIDPGHRTRIPEAFRVWHGDRRVFFDA